MEYVNALKAAEENGLYLKIVTSVKNFDSYNSFYNIYGESEEPCRRIAVLTKNNIIEEVYDDDESSELSDGRIVDGNLWIKEYSLLTNPDKIDLSQLEVSKKLLERLISEK
ncbi:hypothetical protein [uncultured Clostridium sp.]|uniref:hypothetical protein n=1 Tax=uncultured Clostridium sp. TaxID=59620 RepID=UPI0025DD42A2|nr:hypothetical protein [uncultured Clostridium sp.]